MAKKPARSGKSWTPKEVQQLKKEIKRRTGARSVGPALGRGDTLVGSWPLRWSSDLFSVSFLLPPRSFQQRRARLTGALLCGFSCGLGDVGSALRPVQ